MKITYTHTQTFTTVIEVEADDVYQADAKASVGSLNEIKGKEGVVVIEEIEHYKVTTSDGRSL